jgi:hypothetical protein
MPALQCISALNLFKMAFAQLQIRFLKCVYVPNMMKYKTGCLVVPKNKSAALPGTKRRFYYAEGQKSY